MSEKMKFKVLRPVGYYGRRERGETIEMTLADAENIGGEYLESLDPSIVLSSAEPQKAPAKPADTIPSAYKPAEAEAPAETPAESKDESEVES